MFVPLLGILVGVLAVVGIVAVAALTIALRAQDRVRVLRWQVDSLQGKTEQPDSASGTGTVANGRTEAPDSETTDSETLDRDPAGSDTASPPRPEQPPVDPVPSPPPSPCPPPPPPPRPQPQTAMTLEERLSTRFFVWIGGIALALAGVFLVKYTVDAGLLTERVRVLLGAALGLSAIGVGLKLQRRSQRVAQSLVAAGVVDLYAVVWAASKLYGLIPDTVGWGLMAAVTAAAVGLSLRFGPFVAGLGLVGGFSMPLFLGIRVLDPGMLFVHFVLLQIGVLVISARSQSSALRVFSAVASALWGIGWLLGMLDRDATQWLGMFALATATVQTLGARWVPGQSQAANACAWIANAMALLTLSGLAAATDFGSLEWSFLITFAAGSIVLARLDSAHRPLPWIVGLVCAALFGGWAVVASRDATVATVALALTSIFAIGGHIAAWRSERPTTWLVLAGAMPITFGLLAYAAPALNGCPWTLIFSIGTAVLGLGSFILLRHRQAVSNPALVVQLATVGVGAAITAWIAMREFDFAAAWLSIAWLAIGVASAHLARPLRLTRLIAPATAFSLVAASRLALDPVLHADAFATTPIANALPILYATVIVGLISVLRCADREERSSDVRAMATAARTVVLFGIAAIVHHAFTGSLHLSAPSPMEWSTIASCWLVVSIVVSRMPRFAESAHSIGVTALILVVVGPCLLANPLLSSWPVAGVVFFNHSLLIYGVPVVVGAVWFTQLWPLPGNQRAIAGTALVTMVFTGATVQVRQAFTSTELLDRVLGLRAPEGAELYTYSAVWIVLAFAFLAVALWRKAPAVRWASLVVMLAATGKIFWIDTGHLTGLYRVSSFLGLGVSLLAVGYSYQRWVFRPGPTSPHAVDPTTPVQ